MLDPDEIEEIDAEAKAEADDSDEEETEAVMLEQPLDDAPVELEEEPEPERMSRKERRQNRFREANERAEAAQRALEEERRRNKELMHALQTRPAYQPPPPPQQQQDPLQAEVDAAYREQTLLAQEIQQRDNMTQAEADAYQEKVRRAHERYQHALMDQRDARQGNRGTPDAASVQRQVLATQNPDVYGNSRALAYAEAHWKMAVARGASNSDPAVFQAAMDAARRDVLGKRPQARQRTETDRRRYSGNGRGHSATQGAREGRSVTLTREDQKMADALYSHIADDAKRYRTFAREVKAKVADE